MPIIVRQFGDINVGFRFHGLAGEPKDAGVYSVYILAVCFLYSVLLD